MSDFCYSQPMLKRVLRKAEQMDRMLQCVGVDPVRAVRLDKGMAWYEARLRCIACIHDDRCRGWIAERLGQAPSAPPAFCPNAELFASLAEEGHGNVSTTSGYLHARPNSSSGAAARSRRVSSMTREG